MGIVLLEIKHLATAKVAMANNKTSPLNVPMVEGCALMTCVDSNNEIGLWNLHYKHLNIMGWNCQLERRWFLDYQNLIILDFVRIVFKRQTLTMRPNYEIYAMGTWILMG